MITTTITATVNKKQFELSVDTSTHEWIDKKEVIYGAHLIQKVV